MTKIGEAKHVLSTAVREEFGEYRTQLVELSDRAAQLGTDSGGINGASTFWRGIHQQIQAMEAAVKEKELELLATLGGKPKHEIRVNVDPEQLERVRRERMNEDKEEAA